jgi:hypothetical protein
MIVEQTIKEKLKFIKYINDETFRIYNRGWGLQINMR